MKKENLNKWALRYHFDELIKTRKDLDLISKEVLIFYMGVYIFLVGIIFNLAANIVYDMIKDNVFLKASVLVISIVALLLLIYLTKKYVLSPLHVTRSKLYNRGDLVKNAMSEVIADHEEKDASSEVEN